MRIVIFWIMCHLSLGHEKKALLNTFRIFKCIAKELAHIPQKSEGPLEFGFLPLLGAFLGVKEVICARRL